MFLSDVGGKGRGFNNCTKTQSRLKNKLLQKWTVVPVNQRVCSQKTVSSLIEQTAEKGFSAENAPSPGKVPVDARYKSGTFRASHTHTHTHTRTPQTHGERPTCSATPASGAVPSTQQAILAGSRSPVSPPAPGSVRIPAPTGLERSTVLSRTLRPL